MNKKPMLSQEQIHRYFNHLSGAKRIEFLYGLLHLCQPLELRYLGTCLEEIARKDYEYLYHAEQKTNHLPPSSSTSTNNDSSNPASQAELANEEKLDLTDPFTRAHAIVDIALLWAKNRACAVRLYRRLKASESVKLVDMLLERDDLDERVMDEILIIFCLAANHPAFSFDMRTQMSQTLKELEKRERKLKSLKAIHNNTSKTSCEPKAIELSEDSTCLRHNLLTPSSSAILNSNTLNVHASPLLTSLSVINYKTDCNPIRVLIKADWSDNNSTVTWKNLNDIRSFHLQLSNIVYHDDVRLERLMSIAIYLRDTNSASDPDLDTLKKNICIYLACLVYFSSYISTISTLAKFFNSSLKLVDSKTNLSNPTNGFDESVSSSSPSISNGMTPLQSDLSAQQCTEHDTKVLGSPNLSSTNNTSKTKIPTDVAQPVRSIIPTNHGTQTGLEVRNEETQTDRPPGPGSILAEHQDYLRRYSMHELAKLTPNDLVADGLDLSVAQLLCGALDDLKPMSIHLSSSSNRSRSPSGFVQMPTLTASSSSPPPHLPQALQPLLDTALMTVVQQQHPSPGTHQSLPSSTSPKLPKSTAVNGIPPLPPGLQSLPPSLPTPNSLTQNQHHIPLLATHPFLYNHVEPYILPLATIPPGFTASASDFMRLFPHNMTVMAANSNNSNNSNFAPSSNVSLGSSSNSRSTNQSNGTNTSPEQNGQIHHPSPPPSTSSRHSSNQQQQQSHPQSQSHHQNQQQQSSSSLQTHSQSSHHPHPQSTRFRHRQHYLSDSMQYQQNGNHPQHQQQRSNQNSYNQQAHNRQTKACFTCGGIGHLAFQCPEQYTSDSNYSQPNSNNRDGYKLDYRPQQSTPTNLHQQSRQMRSNSNSKTKLRDNS